MEDNRLPPTQPSPDAETSKVSSATETQASVEEMVCDDFYEGVRRYLPFPQLVSAMKKLLFSGPSAPIFEEPSSYAMESTVSLSSAAPSTWSFRPGSTGGRASAPTTPRRYPIHRRADSFISSRSSTSAGSFGTNPSPSNSANVSNFFASSSSSTSSSWTNMTSVRSYSNLATNPFLCPRSPILDILLGKVIITLDGGGIRGVLAIVLLRKIDEELQKWGLSLRDCVDLVGGTSTGGIAGIMYSLLDLPLDKMLEKYFSVADYVFGKTRTPFANFFFTGAKHSSDRQRKIYTKVVEEALGDRQTKLRDERLTKGVDVDEVRRTSLQQFIPMFVVAIDTQDVRHPVIMSSYEQLDDTDKPSSTSNISIVDAAIATSAAPTFFHSLHHEGKEYIDGGVGFNNPTEIALKQLKVLYGEDAFPHTLISFGTGRRHKNPFKAACRKRSRFGIRSGVASVLGMMRTFACMTTDSETIHSRVKDYFHERKLEGYYRFNLDSLADIRLDDNKSVTKAVEMSKEYLEQPETQSTVTEIVLRVLENAAARAALGLARGTIYCADT